ncbi:hypothetical protein NQ314_021474 [Rhamnusium bicolor]|uniref:Retrotransposon gag domain-containing protein n=1 Tax=Rhamnusium bicolor TaxID=1586634 RepID=A0AAV8WHZ5_9CUCU|nr:hypothetical protein NQ314_021474 [Rhamnusium bicolor]
MHKERCEGITYQKALEGLPLLLQANTWWQGIKNKVSTWDEATKLMREVFAPKRQPYQVYIDLFANKQDMKTHTDTLLCHKRAILAELPENTHSEAQQIDFIFELLHARIRAKVQTPRSKAYSKKLEPSKKPTQKNKRVRKRTNAPKAAREQKSTPELVVATAENSAITKTNAERERAP